MKINLNIFFSDYTRYLSDFYLFDDDWGTKDEEYKTYLTSILDYLVAFFKKVEPLESSPSFLQLTFPHTRFSPDHEGFQKGTEEDFVKEWEEGFSSWKMIREKEGITQNPSLQAKSEKAPESLISDKLYCTACSSYFISFFLFVNL